MSRKIAPIMLALGLVIGLATTAFAQGQQPSTGPGTNTDHQNGNVPANATARQQAAQDRYQALADARASIVHGFSENRSTILAEYRASLNETRATFLAGKDAVLAQCNETRSGFTNNTGSTESPEHAKCVADGVKALADQARADNKAARELAQSKLQTERAKGLSEWAKTLRQANEHYQARTGEAPGA